MRRVWEGCRVGNGELEVLKLCEKKENYDLPKSCKNAMRTTVILVIIKKNCAQKMKPNERDTSNTSEPLKTHTQGPGVFAPFRVRDADL